MKNYRIVLGSGSPRRRELMKLITPDYEVITSNKEEDMSGHDPAEMVLMLSDMKASDVATKFEGAAVIVGADTVVSDGTAILGKPKSIDDAFQMLSKLQNASHYVHTGVCIIIREDDGSCKKINFQVATKVNVAAMTADEINAYIATGEPMDKAGAYAIQGVFAPYISGIEGDYYNIVGFPVCEIYHRLKAEGII